MKIPNLLAERLGYLFFAAFCTVAFFYLPLPATIVLTAAGTAYVFYNEIRIFLAHRRKKNLAKSVVDMLNMTSQKRLVDFPLPIVISNRNGDILWYNEAFTSTVSENFLASFRSVLQIENNILSRRISPVQFDRRFYTAYMDCYKFESNEMYIFYFFDTTDHNQLIREYTLSKPIVAHLLIDNYDEVFTGLKESERIASSARIDEIINQWAQASNGILCHLERDRYLFIFENRNLANFISERFSILDRIREIKIAGKMYPTLSIGVGMDGGSFAKNEEAARISLDMALSRGGDQAVLKTLSGYEFFGGRSRGSEKRTRIKTRVIANALDEVLKQVRTAVIMGHQCSDLDSLGASVGMARLVLSRGIDAKIVVDRATDLSGRLLAQLETSDIHRPLLIDRQEAQSYAGPHTAVIVVDTHRANYTLAPELINDRAKIIIVDHHRKAVDCIENPTLIYHEPYASSTCEMVTELFHYMESSDLLPLEADALMAGIFLDTKNYTIRTNTCTFEASSYLRKIGANTVNVKRFFQTDMGTYKNKVQMIRTAETYRKIIAIALWEGEPAGNLKIAASQAADEMLNIADIQASFTLFADKNGNISISARSFGAVNVQLIMEKLNGGGHQTMAGTQMKNVSLQEARRQLTAVIDEYFNESNRK